MEKMYEKASNDIRGLYRGYADGSISDGELFEKINSLSREQIDLIVNSKSDYPKDGTLYYISNNGDDNNDGKSPETAWRTLGKLKDEAVISSLKKGDAVLLERGSIFRGDIVCQSGITYSAYGKGPKPVISGSDRNYADPSLWIETEIPNVYKLTLPIYNVGVAVFNDTAKLGNYNELVGALKVVGVDDFTGYKDLTDDLTFASDLYTKEFYLYSKDGNPGERFDSIELGWYHHLVMFADVEDIVIDNLHIRHTGGHGYTGGNFRNVTVRNCIADYLGGSILHGYGPVNIVRVGNSLQDYGWCDGWYCYNNWCYQIYDTGVTHQYNAPYDKQDCFMDNVEYRGNVFEYCHWAIEWYNYDYEPKQQHFYDTYIADNYCIMSGYGWGSRHRPSGAAAMVSWGLTKNTKNFVAENNVYDRSLGDIFLLEGKGNMALQHKDNIYVQNDGGCLGHIYDEVYTYDKNIKETIKDVLLDTTGVCAFNEDKKIESYLPEEKY